VFFDPNQEIYPGGPPRSLALAPARLCWNCRNTAHIARFAHAVIQKEAELRPGAPEGAVVELASVRDDRESTAEVRRNLHRLLVLEGLRPDQVVVLSTRSRERSPLAKAKLGDFALCPLDAEPGPGRVRFGSLHQFKGLEADAVILTDVHPGDPNSSPRHIYVASSRARHLLVVVQRVGD
jgi:superfamily I DNA/RNA helicase